MNDKNELTIKASDMEGNPITLTSKQLSPLTIEATNLFAIYNSSGKTIYTEDSDGTQHWYCPDCGEEIDIPKLHGCEHK